MAWGNTQLKEEIN